MPRASRRPINKNLDQEIKENFSSPFCSQQQKIDPVLFIKSKSHMQTIAKLASGNWKQ